MPYVSRCSGTESRSPTEKHNPTVESSREGQPLRPPPWVVEAVVARTRPATKRAFGTVGILNPKVP